MNVFVRGSFVRVHFHQGLLGEGERHIVKVSIPSVNVKVPFLQELEAVNLLHKFLVALHINWRGEGPDKKQQHTHHVTKGSGGGGGGGSSNVMEVTWGRFW